MRFPIITPATLSSFDTAVSAEGAAAVVPVSVPAPGAASRPLHPTAASSATAVRARATCVILASSEVGDSGSGQLQHLAGMNEIGILDDVPVGLVDLAPLLRVAVHPLGDLREAVALLDRVGLLRLGGSAGSGGGAAALDT